MIKNRMEELKHVCRLCNKVYPSGKSLGGHMRSHVIANSNASSPSTHKLKRKKALVFGNNKDGVAEFACDDENGYGLRENPRKTWRLVDTTTVVVTSNQERVCKQCGKSFRSLKALCGHMSSHSARERNFSRFKDEDEDEDDSWAVEEEDEEEKEVAMSVINGCSSNSSGIESEQEELALCLMMLSRDSGVGFSFTAESSDNNSVILEGGSSSTYVAKRKNLNFSCDGSVKMNLESTASKKIKCVELENSDSGYFENGAKELESDDSVDGYDRIGSKKVNIGDLSPKKSPPRNSHNKAGRYKCSVCQKCFKTHQALGGHIITHKRKEVKNANYSGENKSNVVEISIARSVDEDVDKKAKGHCCPFCPKVFRSGQALGGHKRSHLIGCSSQDKANLIKPVEEDRQESHPRLLDLNLPAPDEEDATW